MDKDAELKIVKLTLASLNERIFNSRSNDDKDETVNNSIDEYFGQDLLSVPDANDQQQRRTQFIESLDHFHRSVHSMKMRPDETIFEFWENQKQFFPQLYEVACAINTIPPTQVVVERSFSVMKHTFTDNRYNIGQ